MKEKLHRYFSCLMAVLLLLSTTSWKVEKHYCMGHLVDIAFFDTLESCDMDIITDTGANEEIKSGSSCCKDERVIIEGQDVVNNPGDNLTAESNFFLFVFVQSFVNLFNGLEQQIVPYKNYHPPILVCDIALLDQTFLI